MPRPSILFPLCFLLTACATHHGRSDGSVEIPQTRAVNTVEYVYTPPDWPQALTATVRRPSGDGPHPAVLLIHGGGWQRGSPGSMNGIARRLSRHGLVTVNVQYRLAPEYPFPASLHDVQQAMHWIHQQADELDVDASRIAAFGFSSGAHLASLMALVAGQGGELDQPWGGDKTRPMAVVAGGTPADLREWSEGRLVEDYMGGKRDKMILRYEQASPIVHVHGKAPPFFLFHGTRDRIVRPRQARLFHQALQSLDVHSELYLAHYRGHFSSFLFRRGAMNEAIRFLHQQPEQERP